LLRIRFRLEPVQIATSPDIFHSQQMTKADTKMRMATANRGNLQARVEIKNFLALALVGKE
jgi:hypothetical protein